MNTTAEKPPRRRFRPLTADALAWQAEREVLLARIAELERRWWHLVLAWLR